MVGRLFITVLLLRGSLFDKESLPSKNATYSGVTIKPMSQQARESADVIIVGAGIYGVMLALEAGNRGLRACVLERNRVGAATTANWFRIIHGGFRYLQSLDFVRIRQSSAERRWFLNFAPDLVQPLPFLLPLYGEGLKRPMALKAAFMLERVLTADRNRGLSAAASIPPGQTLTAAQTCELFAGVRREGLLGGAIWHDAVVMQDQALLSRLKQSAEAGGAVFEEFTGADALSVSQGRVDGVYVTGANPGLRRAPFVINAAGPWSRALANRFGDPAPELFEPVLAFNLLLDCKPLAGTGLALAGPKPGAPMLFLLPFGEQTLAGTWYEESAEVGDQPRPSEAAIDQFLSALDETAPALGATRNAVVQIYPGWQPLAVPGGSKVSDRPIIVDHAERGGPIGLFSVSGVKYTTARLVAEGVVRTITKQIQVAR